MSDSASSPFCGLLAQSDFYTSLGSIKTVYFVFDIDGTTSFNGLTIEPAICDALRRLRASGHTPVLASARPITDILPMLPTDLQEVACIGANGALIWRNNEVRVRAYIPADAFETVRSLILTYDLAYVVNSAHSYAYSLPDGHFLHDRLNVNGVDSLLALEEMPRAFKIILLGITDRALHQHLLARISALKLQVSEHEDPNGENIDIAASGVHKQAALHELLAGAPYIAFGNDTNDTHMLIHATHAVAVGTKPDIIALCHQSVDARAEAVARAIDALAAVHPHPSE